MATQLALEFATNVPWKRNYQMQRNGIAVDLSGAAMHMQLRVDPTSDEVGIDLSTANGRLVIVDGPNGIWGFNVDLVSAGQVKAGIYDHDMIVTLGSGEIIRPYEGTAKVAQGVTKDLLPWQM